MMMKNLQFRTAANRAATARSGNDWVNFKQFFKGVVMDPRPTNDNENRLRAGSVSDLVRPFFSSAASLVFQRSVIKPSRHPNPRSTPKSVKHPPWTNANVLPFLGDTIPPECPQPEK